MVLIRIAFIIKFCLSEIKNAPETTAEKQDVMKFLDVYDNSVNMLRSCTLAFRTGLLDQGSGICFLRKPLKIEEPVFICKHLSLKIGLTHMDVEKINNTLDIGSQLKSIEFCEHGNYTRARISVSSNASLLVLFDDSDTPHVHNFEELSTDKPLWLVFALCEPGTYVELSNVTF